MKDRKELLDLIRDIKLVEVEVFDYCNRKCSFCPNKNSDRNSRANAQFLDKNAYECMIDNLYSNGYRGTLTFSRYNEPFAFPEILAEYVAYARFMFGPNGLKKIVTNTNGDFFGFQDENLINKTVRVMYMFDEVTIMDYDNKGADYWIEKIESHIPTIRRVDAPDNNIHYYRDGLPFLSVFLNFQENATIEDRGGSLQIDTIKMKAKNDHALRDRPCYEPQKFLGIDFNGAVMPCCNLRHDNHPWFVMGNINNDNIIDIIKSGFRWDIMEMTSENPEVFGPCKRCQKDPGRYTRDDDPGIEYKGERQ